MGNGGSDFAGMERYAAKCWINAKNKGDDLSLAKVEQILKKTFGESLDSEKLSEIKANIFGSQKTVSEPTKASASGTSVSTVINTISKYMSSKGFDVCIITDGKGTFLKKVVK